MAAGRITTIRTYQVDMPLAGQEYTFVVPAGAMGILLQPQSANDIWLAFEVGKSGTDYWTIRQPPARPFEMRDLDLQRDLTLYFQAASPGGKLEVMVLF